MMVGIQTDRIESLSEDLQTIFRHLARPVRASIALVDNPKKGFFYFKCTYAR